MSTERIAELNDRVRKGAGGQLLITSGVGALGANSITRLLHAVRGFDEFTEANDPHGEHDFGSIDFEGTSFFWKIDYFAPDLMHASEDPADAKQTTRVLTVMRADEY